MQRCVENRSTEHLTFFPGKMLHHSSRLTANATVNQLGLTHVYRSVGALNINADHDILEIGALTKPGPDRIGSD